MGSREYTREMMGNVLHDLDRVVRDPRIIDMQFALRMTNASGYLDTGFVPNTDDTVVEIDCIYDDVSTDVFDGAQNPSEMRFYMGKTNGYWRTGFAGIYDNHDVADTNRHVHKLTGTGERFVDGEQIQSYAGSIITQLDPFYLWGKGDYRYPNTWYYGFRAWRGTTLVHDFRPIIAGSNMYSETPAPSNCFWDTVAEQYVEPTVGTLDVIVLQADLDANALARLANNIGNLSSGQVSIVSDIGAFYVDLGKVYNSLSVADLKVVTDIGAEYREFDKIPGLVQILDSVSTDLGREYYTLAQTFGTLNASAAKVSTDLGRELTDI